MPAGAVTTTEVHYLVSELSLSARPVRISFDEMRASEFVLDTSEHCGRRTSTAALIGIYARWRLVTLKQFTGGEVATRWRPYEPHRQVEVRPCVIEVR